MLESRSVSIYTLDSPLILSVGLSGQKKTKADEVPSKVLLKVRPVQKSDDEAWVEEPSAGCKTSQACHPELLETKTGMDGWSERWGKAASQRLNPSRANG